MVADHPEVPEEAVVEVEEPEALPTTKARAKIKIRVRGKGEAARPQGGRAPGTLICPHSRPVRSTGTGGNRLIGVQNRPHVHGRISLRQELIIQVEKLTSLTERI